MATNPRAQLTAEDYLALERVSSTRSEYLNGQIYAMTGGSPAYNILAGNLITLLNSALRPRRCIAFPSDQRVHVPATDFYGYPDVSLVCGRPRYDRHGDSLENPIVLVEVLSPSTEGYDRG